MSGHSSGVVWCVRRSHASHLICGCVEGFTLSPVLRAARLELFLGDSHVRHFVIGAILGQDGQGFLNGLEKG
jgi:hypothetical protein